MNRYITTLGFLGALFTLAGFSHATVIGFGQLGGSNTTIPAALASNAVADGNGFVVSNGATPNVALAWDAAWDIHTSNFFAPIEAQTVGGGAWDNEGDIPRIAQLDAGTHTINFSADPGYAVVLNSFDFGHTAETAGTTNWDLTLTDTGSNVVWSQAVEFVNGSVVTVTPNFTGAFGASYLLTFNRTGETYGSNGRHAVDNLSFNQVQVPEPASVALFGLAALGLGALGRRK
ncbi:MAG: PEP-CTERM sorting domain-containing protein [Planctomycetales bacterium]|nr:PEP-CTERM sorting domain-containing protein [Planctomycetales bacterium]